MARGIPSTHSAGDSGAIISGWLIRLVVVLSAFGVVAMDGISLGSTQMNIDQDAHEAAHAVKAANLPGTSYPRLVQVAEQSLTESSPANHLVQGSVQVARNGAVTLSAERTATTIMLSRIKPLAHYGQLSITVSSDDQTS